MVHIKKLEVYGFKSFGFKNTSVSFEKGLVAVTGPNGSGKSNILDAIMFAIGENSPKAMRVDRFQSLFHDSQNSNHKLVRVNLTFDNSDRGIPIDADSVTLARQMEGQNGESQYILNGKTVSKGAIMDLLEIVLADPNKLNIVQQGMITRISELNSEDRRKIIEDIVGLSYFDEKKAEAMKQLDEADRRLEVAFARMGEIRKRIDELEVERNNQLRYEYLNSEISRLKAVDISNRIRQIKQKLATGRAALQSNTQKSDELSKQLEQLRIQIESLTKEKTEFMRQVDASSRAKAAVASKISQLVHEEERTRAAIAENERRITDSERRISIISQRKASLEQNTLAGQGELDKLEIAVENQRRTLESLNGSLAGINQAMEEISAKTSAQLRERQKVENRLSRLSSLRSALELDAARIEEKLKTIGFKRLSSDNALKTLVAEAEAAKDRISRLSTSTETDAQKLEQILAKIEELAAAKASLQAELDAAAPLMARASSLATKIEERVSVAKKTVNEDVAIAELTRNKDEHGIIGIMHDLLRWDRHYERCVLAAGTDWMKALVVQDLKAMINLAAYAKQKRLARVRIVPLEIVPDINSEQRACPPEYESMIVGRLSEIVRSDYDRLPAFLFSDTLVVRDSPSAFSLAQRGYRTVTIAGELFEPAAGAMALDYGSKLSKLTKAILFEGSVDGLRVLLERLGKVVEKNSHVLRETESALSAAETEKYRLNMALGNSKARLEEELVGVTSKERAALQIQSEIQNIAQEASTLVVALDKAKRRLSLISPAVAKITGKLQAIPSKVELEMQTASKSSERNKLVASADAANRELNRLMVIKNSILGKIAQERVQAQEAGEESSRLLQDIGHARSRLEQLQAELQSQSPRLRELRDEEQKIIDASGNAYAVLQEYESKLKVLSDSDRRLSRENNALEKDSVLLKKEVSDLASEETKLTNDLLFMGYKDSLEEMEVTGAIRELDAELEEVKTKINARADETYVEVIDGYRGMSDRRNQLETERNSIVSFIEKVGTEKKEVFMGAFGSVDSDIRSTFAKMTGGSAWLQIENPEDVFSSGVMLLVQFPNKNVPRESTSLSGGEKTIAAIVFLLALQSLKPSPFYLMDEVDAHLDAENTERLSKILLERSKNNQIIMVTLKDSTVAKASLIYGVYAREGESYVVKYRNPEQVPLAQIAASESKQ